MHSSDDDAEELASRVGQRIRQHRDARQMSSAELAARSGLSRTIVSRIERGSGNPSIGTLWRLSRALAVPLGELLAAPAPPRTRVVRAGEGEAIDDPSGMVGRLVHTDGHERRTELFALELPAGARRGSPGHLHGVEEVVVLTRGRARVGPEEAPATLGLGDAVWFPADGVHAYEAVGRGPCSLLDWILYPPS